MPFCVLGALENADLLSLHVFLVKMYINRDDYNRTEPLHIACKVLCMKGSSVTMHSVQVAMEMIQAVAKKDYAMLHVWILSGVDMYSKDYNDRTAMYQAVTMKDEAMIHRLLQYEAEPLEKDVFLRQTALNQPRLRNDANMSLLDPLFTSLQLAHPQKKK
ncbi:L-asparaginase [Colossoma macropomum]|uniref:L-asparaginase n=1 Tax=Colossoma macropomum TaxID=42526 RepID=UPI0018651513|nr:L-asparaginase [Colossoma macropomum]